MGVVLLCSLLGPVAGLSAAERAGADEVADAVRKAVVKVYATSQAPNEAEPWQSGRVDSGTGSGCVVAGGRILTAAHVVARQTFLQVRRQGETRKRDARVLFVAHDVDLALLAVDDASFFEGIEPLALGPLPRLQSSVVALGFPTGGDTLSLTKGVVSRVEHNYYTHSGGTFLAMQIDAAVNPGNSGGPLVEDQRVVGIAMQTLSGAQNISYAVPAPLIERFLADVADGTYDGVPQLGVSIQHLENRAMRARYGLADVPGGVLVRELVPGSGAAATLRRGDVIESIDGARVGEDGTVEFRDGERTSFLHLVQVKQRGSEVEVAYFRDGTRRRARVALTTRAGEGLLVPFDDHESQPQYLVVGGVVLRPLTFPYVCTFADWREAPSEFLAALFRIASFEHEGLVAMTGVFPDEVNQGYEHFRNVLVAAVDGVRPRNFLHAVELVERSQEEFLTLTLTDTNTIVLNRSAARARNTAILEKYHVGFDRSADLRAGQGSQRASAR